MTTTSISLLQRVRHREDRDAWERFVTLYTPLLLRWSGRAGLAKQDAVDLVQDVFATLLVEMPRFEYDPTRGPFRAWLKTVTMNQCRKQLRKRLVAEGRGGEDDLLSMLPGSDEWETIWNQEYHQQIVRRALEIMQSHFEPKTWQAAWDLTVSRLSVAEVGQRLGMSESALYIAKSRVMRRLRQELDGLLD